MPLNIVSDLKKEKKSPLFVQQTKLYHEFVNYNSQTGRSVYSFFLYF